LIDWIIDIECIHLILIVFVSLLFFHSLLL